MKQKKRLFLAAAWLCSMTGIVVPARGQVDQSILDPIKTMTFRHEGSVNSLDELQFIKAQIQDGVEPWASNYAKMAASSYAKLTYTPHPVAHVDSSSAQNQINDAIAAYTQALMWIFTGDSRYADKSIAIQNAWASTLVDITESGQWYLQASWVGSISPLAAELIRDSYSGWSAADIAQYKAMLNNAFLPDLNKRYAFGNRELSTCSALAAIGVFNDDRAAFYQGIYHWMSYLPCYVYMTVDGSSPIHADYWATEPTLDQYYAMHSNLFPNQADSWLYKPIPLSGTEQAGDFHDDKTIMTTWTTDHQWAMSVPNYFQGGTAETVSRDLSHVENSISAVFILTELARNQDIDLYSGYQDRLANLLEMNAYLHLGNPAPKGGYALNMGNGQQITYEAGYNYLVNVLGMDLPYTRQLIIPHLRSAQAGYIQNPPGLPVTRLWNQDFYMDLWETLTHAELGDGTDLELRGIFSGTPTNSAVHQEPAVDPNTTYTASIWIQGTGAVRLLIRNGNFGSTIVSQRIDATPAWTQVTTPAFSTGSNTQLTVELIDFYNVPGTVHIDNCFLGVAGTTGVNRLANSGFQGDSASWSGSANTNAIWSVEEK